jgi:hypothetical protein
MQLHCTILAALNEGSVEVVTTDGAQSIIEYDTEQLIGM